MDSGQEKRGKERKGGKRGKGKKEGKGRKEGECQEPKIVYIGLTTWVSPPLMVTAFDDGTHRSATPKEMADYIDNVKPEIKSVGYDPDQVTHRGRIVTFYEDGSYRPSTYNERSIFINDGKIVDEWLDENEARIHDETLRDIMKAYEEDEDF